MYGPAVIVQANYVYILKIIGIGINISYKKLYREIERTNSLFKIYYHDDYFSFVKSHKPTLRIYFSLG